MNPNDEIPERAAPAPLSGRAQKNGANGAADEPASYRFSPEDLERIRKEVSPEEVATLVRELEKTGGLNSDDFLKAVERAAQDDG